MKSELNQKNKLNFILKKTNRSIVNFRVQRQIETVVVGDYPTLKQRVNMIGRKNQK
jgi:hypothetical protein